MWRELAACTGTDTEVFFPPDPGRGKKESPQAEVARNICAGCEVRQDCLEWALGNDEQFGILGGLTPRERREYVR